MTSCRNACPDCPARRNAALTALIGERCALSSVSIPSRQPLPSEWFRMFGFLIVRRGIVVRQRIDARGEAVALDAIGPGAAAPLWSTPGNACGGYAAADALVCLVPCEDVLKAASPTDESQAAVPDSRTARDLARARLVQLYEAALERVERIAAARGRRGVSARVAALLCALSDCLAPPSQLQVVPSSLQQRDLAALLALRHESVCRAIKGLERRALLKRGNDGIRVLDRAGLEAV